MTVTNGDEMHNFPEILESSDYIIPAPEGRADLALQALLFKESNNNTEPTLGEELLKETNEADGERSSNFNSEKDIFMRANSEANQANRQAFEGKWKYGFEPQKDATKRWNAFQGKGRMPSRPF